LRILHTADWHVGKKLGREERKDTEGALNEIVDIARDREVDAVLVAGDLFDRATPPLDSLNLVLGTLLQLAKTGAKVVAIPGNHDSPELFRVLAPLLEPFGVHLVHKPLEPDQGGIVSVTSRDGKTTMRVACVPFIHESSVIDLMGVAEEGYKDYADRIRKVTSYYARWMVDHPQKDTVDVLMAHFMVHKAIPSGTERELHIGEAYMAAADAIPTDLKYAALGHIHLAQEVPGSSIPARFSGGLLQLDFGEAGIDKSVCIVDLEPGMKPARVDQAPVTSGRTLTKVTGTIDELRARAGELGDSFLHVTVKTTGPEPGLADEIRSFLPHALQIHADYPRVEAERIEREGRSLTQIYGDYWLARKGTEAPPEYSKAFSALMDEVGVNW
jgi:exonuclease SbcD